MAKQPVKRRDWTKEDIRTLKTLARENTKTTVIARRLKRSVGATYQQASKLVHRFQSSNHIRRLDRVCKTTCGRPGPD
jgi:hypothetical protein